MPDTDAAETANLQALLSQVGAGLDTYLQFAHPDAQHPGQHWRDALDIALPPQGVGIRQVAAELLQHVIPNGSTLTRPGCSSFITTGSTTAATLRPDGIQLSGVAVAAVAGRSVRAARHAGRVRQRRIGGHPVGTGRGAAERF